MAPVYAWPLMVIGYWAFISNLVQTSTWKQATHHTFVFFFGYYLTCFYWVSSSLLVDFDQWWWALPFSFAGLPLLLALFPTALVGLLFFILSQRSGEAHGRFFFGVKSILVISTLILADIARGHVFTGFPWNFPAHTWVNTDIMMATLPHIGLYGLNAMTIILFAMPAFLKLRIAVIYILGLIAISLVPLPPQNLPDLRDDITMIQGNIPQDEKWDPRLMERNFDRYIDMTTTAIATKTTPQIIIWPETTLSQNFLYHPPIKVKFNQFLDGLPRNSLLVSGYLNHHGDNSYNSLVIFNRDGDIIDAYDKHHLVPFGEYMPFGLDTITGFNGFSSGNRPSPIALAGFDLSILPIICYESIFSKYFKPLSQGDNTIALIITNDAWFGNTAGPFQHFDHAIFRAKEYQNTIYRLSGNGISGIIDANGHVRNATKINVNTVLN